jgi:hypothetical protein
MATFQLKNGFGLNETIMPGKSALSKYFLNLPDFAVATIDLVLSIRWSRFGRVRATQTTLLRDLRKSHDGFSQRFA